MSLGFRKANPPIGARPGTLAIPEGSPPPRIRVFCYDRERCEEAEVEVGALEAWADRPGRLWVDVRGLGDEGVLRRIAAVFGIHPLALEDAVNVPQRAKSERHERHHLVIGRVPLRGQGGELTAPQVCFLIGERILITFQERFLALFEPVRERLRDGLGPMRGLGPDYLAYALLDTMVDHYYPLAIELAEIADELEDRIAQEPDHELLPRIHRLRKDLLIVRRVGWPQREAVTHLIGEPSPIVTDAVRAYLRDVGDHIAQIMELVDSARDAERGLMEIYLSQVSQRTNEVMKVLTLMASIFIPLTFIAGVYGMNFEYMPELRSPRAYPVVLALMVAVAVGMIAWFRRRRWF